MEDYPNVHYLDHPLIRHKVAKLRSVDTDHKNFRDLVEEIAALMVYESFRDIPTVEVEVETPLERCRQTVVKENSVAIVAILRAGLGMVDGVLRMLPSAKVGHIGLTRNEETYEPEQYYCKLPKDIGDMVAIVVDPMLATGGSASDALALLKSAGCTRLKLLSIIAAPEGVRRVASEHPDVDIYISTLDRGLNDDAYILPGLGDAGDRIFGTR